MVLPVVLPEVPTTDRPEVTHRETSSTSTSTPALPHRPAAGPRGPPTAADLIMDPQGATPRETSRTSRHGSLLPREVLQAAAPTAEVPTTGLLGVTLNETSRTSRLVSQRHLVALPAADPMAVATAADLTTDRPAAVPKLKSGGTHRSFGKTTILEGSTGVGGEQSSVPADVETNTASRVSPRSKSSRRDNSTLAGPCLGRGGIRIV